MTFCAPSQWKCHTDKFYPGGLAALFFNKAKGMTELRDYKDKNFSVAINTRMKGIEITFNKPMTNEMLAEIKEAGFKWSKRQQKWWAYQNEGSIAFANGLIEMADNDETERMPDEEEKEVAYNNEFYERLGFSVGRLDFGKALDDAKEFYDDSIERENGYEMKHYLVKQVILQGINYAYGNTEEIEFDDLYKLADDIVRGRLTDKAALDERMGNLMPRTRETENPGNETTVDELAELIRRRAELDRKIAAMKGSPAEQERKAEKPAPDEQNPRKEKTAEIVAERADKDQAETTKKISPEENAEEKAAEEVANATPETTPENSVQSETEEFNRKTMFPDERHTPSQTRIIREHCREILGGHTDEEIRANAEFLNILAQYEGGGGIAGEDGRTSSEVLNAFYTPRNVIDAVWKIAEHYAPNARTVLEPTAGIGRFAENRDGDKEFTLREIDETSARIARILHPNATVIHGAFQAQFFDETGRVHYANAELPKYDIVIGNPPYGAYSNEWKGKGEGKEFDRHEEYFIKRGLDSLNENGILAFVVPSGFLNGSGDRQKEIIAESGALVDAYRLPEGVFPTTQVGTDIVVFETWKRHGRLPQERLRRMKEYNAGLLSGGRMFKEFPMKVLGEIKTRTNRFGREEEYVVPHEGLTVQDEIKKIAGIFSIHRPNAQTEISENDIKTKETELAVKIANRYVSVQKTDDGYDYSILDEDYKTIDGGEIDASSDDINKTLSDIVEDLRQDKFPNNAKGGIGDNDEITVVDYDWLETKARAAEVNPDNAARRKNPEPKFAESATELPAGIKEKEKAVFAENPLFKLFPYEKALHDAKPSYEIKSRIDALEKEVAGMMPLDPERKEKAREAETLKAEYEERARIEERNREALRGKEREHRRLRHEKILRLEKVYEWLGTETLRRIREESMRLSSENMQAHREEYYGKRPTRSWQDDIAELEIRHLAAEAEIHRRAQGYLLGEEMRRLPLKSRLDFQNFLKKGGTVMELEERLKRHFGTSSRCGPYRYDVEFNAKGIKITLDRQEPDILGGETATYTWNAAASTIKRLVEANEYVTEKELEESMLKRIADTLSEKNFGSKWDRKSFSLQYHAEDGSHLVSVIFASGAERLLEELIDDAENFNAGEFADDLISQDDEKFDGEEHDDRNERAAAVAEEVEAALVACLPELRLLRREACVWRGVEPLAPEEAIVVEKIAEGTKMDSWLEIDGDGYLFDTDNGTYLDASELLGDFRAGFEADEHNIEILSEGERKIWGALVERLSGEVQGQVASRSQTNAAGRDIAGEVQATESQKNLQQENLPRKQKGDTMTSREFARLYGKEFSEVEFKIWRAIDWEGIIDLAKLDENERKELQKNSNYVEIEPDEWTHRALFLSGDIEKKIQEYEKKASELEEHDTRKLELYRKNIEILKGIAPKVIPMESLHLGVNTTLAEEFKIEHKYDNGETVELNLQESFILWACGESAQAQTDKHYYRGNIDFAMANISREDFPENVSWSDVVEYIDKKPVKAEPTYKFVGMTDEDVAYEKMQKKREADEKRIARAETADRLFDKYLHEGLSEDLRKKVEAEYNRRFNSYIIPDYSKLPLAVDGMSAFKGGDKFRLYDQQIKGISFLSNKGNGLLAYDVGVGKTAAGIVANVNQIQLGRSKRPLIIVPNSVYTKWYNDIKEFFPNVQVNDLYNFNKESLKKFRDGKNPNALNIPENSISICTYEALKNISFTDESCENALYEDFAKLLSEDFDGNATENAKGANKIKNTIGSASQVKNSNFVFFEKCGFDNITVDEAHNFKNLWTVPRPKKKGESQEFSGIPSGKPSARALKLFAMTQIVQRENDNRNVFLLTATPFTNSPLEVYSMLSYVGRQRLVESGIYSLRDFLTQFAHTKLEMAVNSRGEIDYKQVMKDWKELPALQNILTEYIDKVDGEEAGIIRPNKFTHVKELDLTDIQKKMIETDTELMMEVKEGKSAAVIVAMNAMRMALVAPALADKSRYPGIDIPPMSKLVDTSPKLKFVCDSIIDMYRTNHEKGQFMYMPLGQEAHGMVKDYLVAHGVPKDSVEIINGSTNNSVEKKEKITERFNDEKDKLKIIIGGKNTSEGIDLNGNSFVMYNCALGWNPSETIQAEGRIWRQGNMQGNVHCVYPVMNDSIDSVLYQKHDEKRSRINDLWTYKGENLNVEDINPEDLKFDLIKDPAKRAKMILDESTKNLKSELQKSELRIKSLDEIIKKRTEFKKKFEEAKEEFEYRENLKKDYKDRNINVPEWLKLEIADSRKKMNSNSLKLDAVGEKLERLGYHDNEGPTSCIRKMNEKKKEIEKEIEMKKFELPSIIARLRDELNKKNEVLPPLEEQRKELCDEIVSNLRPMREVESEIRQERFEKMLDRKIQQGEITVEQMALYKQAGFRNYQNWLDGETESLETTFAKTDKGNSKDNATESKIYKSEKEILTDNFQTDVSETKATAKARKAVTKENQPFLFNEEYLDSLSATAKSKEMQGVKISEIVNSVKEKSHEKKLVLDEQANKHLVVGGIIKSKKQRAGMER